MTAEPARAGPGSDLLLPPPPAWGPSLIRWLWLGPLLLTMLLPFVWMVVISLAPHAGESFARAIRGPWSLDAYRALFAGGSVARYVFNSAIVAAAVVTLNVATAAMVGWVLGRNRIPGGPFWSLGLVATLMLPKQVLMIPLFLIMNQLRLIDTYASLVLPFAVDAFSIFLVRQYVSQLPMELEDAARVDGASDFEVFLEVVVPLLRPVLAVVAIQSFLTNWNSFLFPLVFINSDELRTLPVGLALLSQGEQSVNWGLLMAGSTVASLPVLAMFVLFQRRILSGLLAGAEK